VQISELDEWLQGLPIDDPVDIDGESVYLKISGDGAELGVVYLDEVTGEQINDALRRGFQMAMEFDAGWALSADGSKLLLTQWLPGVHEWTEVPDALELLLNQVAALRAAESAPKEAMESLSSRDERRIRSKLFGS